MGDSGAGGKNIKDKTEELMSKKEIATKINKKKAELAPTIKELKALRESIDVYDLNKLNLALCIIYIQF